jgi:D-arabinose 1-dehydrogenase-like Zn-dependent alcohol dehydrogenase
MRAIVVRTTGGPDALSIETVPEPIAAAGQVVIAVESCGVCFHDVVTRNGTLKAGIALPFIPGHEVSGRISAIGPGVEGFAKGDRVATLQRSHVCGRCRHCRAEREPLCDEAVFMGDAGLNGGYAQFVAVGAENVVPLPDAVSFDDGAIAACAIGTCLHAVRRIARVEIGETVLVTGAGGGLGIHAVQLARLAGARVIAQTTSPDKVDVIREAGADHVVLSQRGEDFAVEVKAATGAIGVDVVIDTVGTPVFAPARRSLAKAGRWVIVGQLTGDFVPFNPAQLFLRGVSMLSATSTTRQELIDVLDLIARGVIRPHIARSLPLDQAAEAHRIVESGKAIGRVVVRPGS